MAFFKYFLIRAAIFLPLFVLFMFLRIGAIFSALLAVTIAFCISYLFFRKQRDAAAEQLRNRFSGNARPVRGATELSDADAEDGLVDAHPDVIVSSDRQQTTAHFAAPSGATSVPKDFLE